MSDTTPESDDKRPQFRPPIRREAPENMERGLKAVEASRTTRNKVARPPLKVIVWFAMSIAVGLILYFRWESTQVESARNKLLNKQREAIAHWGNQWFDVRDSIEGWTVELAGKPETDFVDPELSSFKFREMPGVYLRMRKDQAADKDKVREAAMRSLRDGFTSCLMHNKAEVQTEGPECVDSKECEAGLLCNDFNRCSKPGQPYNLRLAYKAFSVLSPEWEKEARETTNSLTLRAMDLGFDEALRNDFPIAIDLLAKAKFFLVVVDERPAPAAAAADGGPSSEDVELAAGTSYPSRIALFRLADKKLLMRITVDPKPEFLQFGNRPGDTKQSASLNKQVQSCALAAEVVKVAEK